MFQAENKWNFLTKIFSHEHFEQDQLSHKDNVVQISAYYGKLSVLRLVISFDNNLSLCLSSCEAGAKCYLFLAYASRLALT